MTNRALELGLFRDWAVVTLTLQHGVSEARDTADSLLDRGLLLESWEMVVNRVEDNFTKLGSVFGSRREDNVDSLWERVTVPRCRKGILEAHSSTQTKTIDMVLDCDGEHLGVRDDRCLVIRGCRAARSIRVARKVISEMVEVLNHALDHLRVIA